MQHLHEQLDKWCCRGCDAAFVGTPPWHLLCAACLAYLESQGFVPDPEWPQDQVPPLCEGCGKQLVPVIPAILAREVTGP